MYKKERDEDSGTYSNEKDDVIQIEDPDDEEDEQVSTTPIIKASTLSPIKVQNSKLDKLRSPTRKRSELIDQPVTLPTRSPTYRKNLQDEIYQKVKESEALERSSGSSRVRREEDEIRDSRERRVNRTKKNDDDDEILNDDELSPTIRRVNERKKVIENEESDDREDVSQNRKIEENDFRTRRKQENNNIQTRREVYDEEELERKRKEFEEREESYIDEEEENIIRRRRIDLKQQKREKRLRENETPIQTAIRMTENPHPRYNDIMDDENIVEECYRELESKYNHILDNKKLVKKYKNLKDILKFSRKKPLKILHEEYYDAIRNIYADKKSGNYKVGYEIFALSFEYLCVKTLGFNVSGISDFLAGRRGKAGKFFREFCGESFSYGTSDIESSRDVKYDFLYDTIFSMITFFLVCLFAKQFNLNEDYKQKAAHLIDSQMTSNINVNTIVSGEILNDGSEELEEENTLISLLRSAGSGALKSLNKTPSTLKPEKKSVSIF